jgi:hypothetical protein
MSSVSDLSFWVPALISVAAVVLSYVDLRFRQKQEKAASRATTDLILAMRQEIQILQRRIEIGATNNELIRQQELAHRQEQEAWNRLKDVAKGVGWLLERASEEQYDDEYEED